MSYTVRRRLRTNVAAEFADRTSPTTFSDLPAEGGPASPVRPAADARGVSGQDGGIPRVRRMPLSLPTSSLTESSFRRVLANITGAIVNVDEAKVHENEDGSVDRKK